MPIMANWINSLPNNYQIRRWFHWKHSGVLIPLFFGSGLAMIGVAISIATTELWLFVSACVAFFLTFVWTTGCWLTSDTVQKRNPSTWSRNRRKTVDLSLYSWIYWLWKYVGSVAWAAILVLCLLATMAIYNRKNLSQMYGLLVPADDPSPVTSCGALPRGAIVFTFGRSAYVSTGTEVTVIQVGDKSLLSISCRSDGSVGLTADVRDRDGKVVLLVSPTAFHVNRNAIVESLFYRPDHSTINLTDNYDNVLRVRFMNNQAVSFEGKLYYAPNAWIEIGEDGILRMMPHGAPIRNNCTVNTRVIVQIGDP